jgi:hypothetical protein
LADKVTEAYALGTFAQRGFTLEQVADDDLSLFHEGEKVGTFSQIGADPSSIQKECADHLVKRHGWDGCIYDSKKQEGR